VLGLVFCCSIRLTARSRVQEYLRRDLGKRCSISGALWSRHWSKTSEAGVIEVTGQAIHVKAAPGRVKPEFNDVVTAAERTGLTPHEVSSRAGEASRHRRGEEPGTKP